MVEHRPFPCVLSGQINIQRNLNVQALLEILGRCFLSQQVNPIWASLWTKPWMFKNIFFSARKIGTFIIKCFNRKLTSSSLLSTGRKTEWVCLIINVKYHLATCHCIVKTLRRTSQQCCRKCWLTLANEATGVPSMDWLSQLYERLKMPRAFLPSYLMCAFLLF